MTGSARGPLGAAERLKKLRAMSPRELWTRVRYDGYCRIERKRHARGALAHGGDLRRVLVPRLARARDWRSALLESRRARSVRFFAGAEDLSSTRAILLERYPQELCTMRAEADRAARHEFSFFGGTHTYNGSVDWHADPVTHARWPVAYHRDVPVHGGDVGFGDVKHVWELGRHQFLIDLAKAWAVDRQARHSVSMRELVADWRAQNPVGTGVAWTCALEPAFRALSWLWAYFLTLDDPAFDDDSHVQWLEGFYEHGWFIYRHLEYFTSPFNHLAGEACALYCLGVLFPEFREARRWRGHGRHLLESRLPTQFYADGGSVEQSPFYHHATTGFYLLAMLLGRVNGEAFSPEVGRALERAIDFATAIQQPDGTIPTIGGADDGKPIRMEHRKLWDFRPYQSIGAVLFDRPDFKWVAGRFFEDALWLLGPEGAASFDALQAEPPKASSRVLPSSGYVVLRSAWSPDADYVCFDCGEQAAGLRRDGIASAAHGHADGLSLIVWRKGRPVLVDPGLFCYNGPKPWQDHFRETAAHNTIRIDGRDQALHLNKMAWSNTYTATLEGYDLDHQNAWAVASHDGFRALPTGAVTHRRRVWVRERGYIVIADLLEGTGSHDVELTFQFAPGRLTCKDACASFEDRVAMRWFAPVPLAAQLHEGDEGPAGGWIAPSLGVKTAAPRLVLSARLQVPVTLVTVLLDRDEHREVTWANEAGSSSLVVCGDGWSDTLVVEDPRNR
jgi:hypothetical protein